MDTGKNTVISPDFLVWKFCGKAQFPYSFGNSPKTMRKLCLSGAFVLLLLLLLSIMPIDNITWYARIGVFQPTKLVTQSNSFQKDKLNFTAQNIAFMYNKMSIKFFLILFFVMWVLLKINFDISWSVIAKCIKGPLMSTHFAKLFLLNN